MTSNPHGDWIVQQARNLTIDLGERERSVRVLLHDRDAKFSAAFDEVFRSEGVRIIRTPIRAPTGQPVRLARSTPGTVRRRDRLSGLIHEYEHAA